MMSKTGLYFHIPFCQKKCFYCSFCVVVAQENHQDDYVWCLAQEMLNYKNLCLDSIYFGGGTPSRISEKNISRLFDALRECFIISSNAEVTIEMNPEDVTAQKLRCYYECGVNRLSLGVQTFQDPYLKFLGRNHDHVKALQAYDLMRAQGFDNVNVDLMYGFPSQTGREIDRDLSFLKKLSSEHVSLYTLTLEQGSRFFVQGIKLPGQEESAVQYLHVRERLLDMGYGHYEVSNFAKHKKESLHNLNYWKGGNYIGLGNGAHSHMDGKRWWNTARLRLYIEAVRSRQSPEDGCEYLKAEQRIAEALVFGLRMTDGIHLNDFQKQFGNFSLEKNDVIENLINDGFLKRHNGRMQCTLKGMLVLDAISEKLI